MQARVSVQRKRPAERIHARLLQDYGLAREDLDFVFGVTHFKTQAAWGADPFKARARRYIPCWHAWLTDTTMPGAQTTLPDHEGAWLAEAALVACRVQGMPRPGWTSTRWPLLDGKASLRSRWTKGVAQHRGCGCCGAQPIDPKVKAAFTRAFNKSGIRPRCNLAVEEFKRGRGKGKKGAAAKGDDEDEDAGTGGVRLPAGTPRNHAKGHRTVVVLPVGAWRRLWHCHLEGFPVACLLLCVLCQHMACPIGASAIAAMPDCWPGIL